MDKGMIITFLDFNGEEIGDYYNSGVSFNNLYWTLLPDFEQYTIEQEA